MGINNKPDGKIHKKSWALIITTMISITLIIVVAIPVIQNARAYIVSPRFGAPIRLDSDMDSASLDSEFVPMDILLGVSPSEKSIPSEWLSFGNWEIGVSTSYLLNASIETYEISQIKKISNPFTSAGYQDSSPLARNAIEITVNIPKSAKAGLYNLHVAYETSISDTTIIINAGDHLGDPKTASSSVSFVLSEANCIYIPSEMDSLAFDSLNLDKIPFSLIQASDIHVDLRDNPSLPHNHYRLDAIMQAISIWAPDLFVISGDLTDNPHEFPKEYEVIYNLLRGTGIPIFTTIGNHDHKGSGLFPYYFGPIQHVNQWGGTRLIGMNSVLPPNGENLEWIISNIKQGAENDEATFFVAHYPIMDVLNRQMQSSVGAILDAMVKYDSAGVLNGHNHYSIVFDMKKSLGAYYSSSDMLEACDIPDIVGDAAPEIESPKIFLVTSASKTARENLIEFDIWDDYVPYLGYRRLTLEEGRVINYTYDFSDSGVRDPSYCHPAEFENHGGVNWTFSYDPNDLEAGASYSIINNLTESIQWARAAITLPKVNGFSWELMNPDAVIRTQFSNATHQYLDVRINALRRQGNTPTTTVIDLQLVPNGGI